jgi:hypothetical protein
VHPDIRTARQHLKDHVKRIIQQVLHNYIGDPRDAKQYVQHAIVSSLHSLKSNETIRNFEVEVINPGASGLQEVDDLEASLAPGDVATHPDGSYRGIVISADGDGYGVIMQSDPGPTSGPGEVLVRCKVQPIRSLDYIQLIVKA